MAGPSLRCPGRPDPPGLGQSLHVALSHKSPLPLHPCPHLTPYPAASSSSSSFWNLLLSGTFLGLHGPGGQSWWWHFPTLPLTAFSMAPKRVVSSALGPGSLLVLACWHRPPSELQVSPMAQLSHPVSSPECDPVHGQRTSWGQPMSTLVSTRRSEMLRLVQRTMEGDGVTHWDEPGFRNHHLEALLNTHLSCYVSWKENVDCVIWQQPLLTDSRLQGRPKGLVCGGGCQSSEGPRRPGWGDPQALRLVGTLLQPSGLGCHSHTLLIFFLAKATSSCVL